MSWSASKIYAQTVLDSLANAAALDLSGGSVDTFKAALFDNTITPDNTVSASNSAFGAGVWASGEVFDGSNWHTGGEALVSPALSLATATVKFDATDTASATSTATLASVYGCLVYDDTIASPVADQGICFNYFGGSNAVTSGTFTIVWNASGIFTIAC